MLLEVRDLNVTYRGGANGIPAVRGVSFDLDSGQTLGVAGESGSGKSTVALALLRLLPDSARVTGSVRFKDTELTTARWGQLRAVRWAEASVVFQGAMNALNPVQTIGAQIAEPIELHERVRGRDVRNRVDELLDCVGVPSRRRGAYPHELSGGQRQRVMIAMALACRPDLIIADEPTTALDVIVQAQILQLLTDLVRDAGIGMMMISHDLSVLAETCERMAIMYAGQVVEIGSSRDLITAPKHPYTRARHPRSRRSAIRRRGSRPPACPATRPTRPRSAPAARSSRVARCASTSAATASGCQLWDAGPSRESACLRVLPDYADPPASSRLPAPEPPTGGENPAEVGA